MSPISSLKNIVAYVLIFALVMTGLLTLPTRWSYAANNSQTHSLTPTVNEPSQKTGPQADTVVETTRARVSEAPGKLPLSFEANRGQVDHRVKYLSRGAGYTLFLTETETVLALRSSDGKDAATAADARRLNAPARPPLARTDILRMKLNGANHSPTVSGEGEMSVGTSDTGGGGAEQRQTDVARYERVRFSQVYPGIDMIYYGERRQLKYDFEVAPGTNTRQIALEFQGVKQVKVESATGELMLETARGELRQPKPVTYQEVGGVRHQVASSYVALSKSRVGIEVGEYDRARPLVINRVLSYLTPPSVNSQDSGTTSSFDSQRPKQDQKDQPVRKPADFGPSIYGWVADDSFNALTGVLMVLDGTEFSITYTDDTGYFSFDGLQAGGDYIVYPVDDNYTFEPEQYEFYDIDLSEGAYFTAHSTSGSSISGTITNSADGAGLAGVTLTMTCDAYPGEDCIDPQTTTTAGDGTYSFTGVPTPIHFLTIKPSKTNYRFSPTSQFLFLVPSDATDIDFSATSRTYAIIGTVKLGAARIPGVTVKLTSPLPAGFAPRTVTTNSGGAYAFDNLPPSRDYTVTPMNPGYQITPVSKSVSDLSANQMGVDFTVKSYSITGRITRPANTTGIGAVTVTLTSPTLAGFPARSVRTDSTGAYTFTSLPAGNNYTIKVVKSRFTFTPAVRSFANLSHNIPAGATTNFTGTGP